jgi:mannose-6-phosphate isomerase class I
MLTPCVANDKRKRIGVIARKQYLVDVQMLAIIFLNYVKLALREAIYLDANVPLAYLSSKIIECMVAFDNVVNHTKSHNTQLYAP